jgi:hypothetical protein
MGIEPKFNIDDLFNDLGRKINAILEGVIEAMQKTCLEITNKAKQLDTYQDQTNNLRSSIGYVVYNNGEKVAEHFTQTGAGSQGTGTTGIAKGKKVAEEAAKEFPNDLVGVVVAGEDYALYVESKGYDVITGPCLEAYSILEKNLKLVFE